ncbi:hypothetical protein KC363_g1805 [Hortaea werneckii]|uniref:Uncharacterized protein n=1 Tax=Hortaea werneckii TaxID=91943 RepID=A0A3M7FZZ7_HORWE|nr:hypothetical protein KC361_g3089 [Hortaea werneckii]KAI6886618.1 hypothetical protein KC325_g2683 [Hortaea werneckii]KAI7000462.1 hypothetical protein KC359_g1189 [Hortaea werneckii]KAI7147921.1 hypothetical protein KC344_g2402 [Hortaea werneckii]KAI7177423.1 hypothetical protein KC360_g2365 [Hortaea werneckii]
MPSSRRVARPAMYNTPHIRNGGFGALQVEALTNRPLSIARRHLAASQLRMRHIEPDELSSSEWVRFLVMSDNERERWMTIFQRRRRNSDESSSSADNDRQLAYDKAEEAAAESADARRDVRGPSPPVQSTSTAVSPAPRVTSRTPAASILARFFDEEESAHQRPSRPRHRRAVTDGVMEAPPTYEDVLRARTPPPAYEARSDDEGPTSPRSP